MHLTCLQEISLEVFLQVYWLDRRVRMADNTSHLDHLELTWGKENDFWVPDLYIRQLREMKVLSLFQDMASVRLYRNQTMRVSIGSVALNTNFQFLHFISKILRLLVISVLIDIFSQTSLAGHHDTNYDQYSGKCSSMVYTEL